MTDTSVLVEGHYLATSYPAAWCQCHHSLRWETRAEDHAAHVVVEIQARALRDAAVARDVPAADSATRLRITAWLRDRADRLTTATEESTHG